VAVKRLYVCGCSFLSSYKDLNKNYPFHEQYTALKGLEHVSLARGGASNFLIRLQIERAIRDSADYVLVGATSSNRIDFPILDAVPPTVRLEDVDYREYNNRSDASVKNDAPTITTDTLLNWTDYFSAFNGHRKYATPEIIESIKQYILYLHHEHLQSQKDYYIIRDGLRDLVKYNIPFVFIPGPLRRRDWTEFGNSIWAGVQPWDIQYGWNTESITHNPPKAHDEYLEILNKMTEHWTN
jgi:hypothetical protein